MQNVLFVIVKVYFYSFLKLYRKTLFYLNEVQVVRKNNFNKRSISCIVVGRVKRNDQVTIDLSACAPIKNLDWPQSLDTNNFKVFSIPD